MKRIYFILSIFLFITLISQAQPRISFDKTTQNLGYVLWRNPATVVYNFTNTGDKPLVISNVTTSCGCTKAEWTPDPVPAGGKGSVTVVFDAEAIGHFFKEAGVYCNASSVPVYVDFEGEVTADPKNYSFTHPLGFGAIRLDNAEIEFEDVNKGEKPFIEFKVANTSSKAYAPTLMHLPSYLEVEADPAILGANKNGKIRVTLNSDKLPKFGITRTSVYLSRFSGDKVCSENEIPVSVVLLPDLSNVSDYEKKNPPRIGFSAEELNFPDLKPTQKKSQTIAIENKGRSDLVIQDMQVFGIALMVNLKKSILKPGEKTKMKVTVLAENLPRLKKEQRILMITNDPMQPKIDIYVKASIKK